MKHNITTFIIFFFFTINSILLSSSSKSILFIGNSYTGMNNFSKMVSEIGLEQGDTLITDFVAIDSYTLEKHFSNKKTLAKIKERNGDYIVLQEQSQRPVLDIKQFNAQTLRYAERLTNYINTFTDAEVLLFMTGGRKNGDASLCSKYKYTCNYEEMQDKLAERYYMLGDGVGADVVPCGIAWRYVIDGRYSEMFDFFREDDLEDIELFHPDNSHPSITGSYLNALVFYGILLRKDAIHCKYNPAGLSEEALLYLQYIANEVVKQTYFLSE